MCLLRAHSVCSAFLSLHFIVTHHLTVTRSKEVHCILLRREYKVGARAAVNNKTRRVCVHSDTFRCTRVRFPLAEQKSAQVAIRFATPQHLYFISRI